MKVGFCTGVFDLFHVGHAHFLRNCSIRCQYLIVAVNHDRWCQRKGPARPFNPLHVRMSHVAQELDIVRPYRTLPHYSIIPFAGNDLALAAEIKPDVIFRGWDQRIDSWSEIDKIIPVTSGTIPVIRIGHLEGFSTTLLASSKEPST